MERIYRRCEGNPFYAEQLLAAGAGPREVALPSTLGELLLVRVEALSQQAQQVVRTVAVAGHAVSHDRLAQLTGRLGPHLEGALREAVQAGVLLVDRDSEVYRLRHALLREAVYGDLLPGERVRLHAAYARLLADDSTGAAAELAYHCLATHDLTGVAPFPWTRWLGGGCCWLGAIDPRSWIDTIPCVCWLLSCAGCLPWSSWRLALSVG